MQVTYSIPGWEKYNPRKERRAHTWFRLEKDFFTSQDGFVMQPVERMLFLLLCCERCGKVEDLVQVRLDYVAAVLKIELHETINAFQRISNIGVVKLHEFNQPDSVPQIDQLSPPVHHLGPVGTLRTNERTNEHSVTNSANAESLPALKAKKLNFDFEEIYRDYPRKEGKKKGLLQAEKQIKTREDFEKLHTAAKNYAQKVIEEKTEKRYIKHFSSFMGCWQDYLEEENQTQPKLHPFAATRQGPTP